MGDHVTNCIGAIDQGTTSTRFIVFDRAGRIVSSAQKEHRQIFPKPGWVEHDPAEIWRNTKEVIAAAMERGSLRPGDLSAIGIANQRETTLVWERSSGRPIANAIVWQDTRTDAMVREYAKEKGPGTIDTFLAWNLTGGPDGGAHVTDVTNASRTQLMNLTTLEWDSNLLSAFGIPRVMLPKILSSSEKYGIARLGSIQNVAISGILGDQQAALVGQACFDAGATKNTYGTGCFLLMNTGD